MKKIRLDVFFPSFIFFTICIIINASNGELFLNMVNTANSFICNRFGWMLILLAMIIFLTLIAIYFSDFGKIKIGGKDAKPTMNLFSWFTINICTTIACGIIFWSAAEPIQHLLYPPDGFGLEALTPGAAKFAMSAIFTHWTVLPYGIYTICAVMFAYGYYNMKKSYSLATMISPLMNGKENNTVKVIVDNICLFTLIAGLAGSMGVGVMNLCGGLHNLFGWNITTPMKVIVTLAIVGTFIASATSGIMKGVRRLSNLNVYIYIIIIVFVFLFGGTNFICSFGVESIGEYLSNFFKQSMYTGAVASDNWAANWPVFYFASWMAWAPITAIFLGKIAYGRRIKDLVTMNLFVSSIFTALWFSILSGATINFTLNYPDSGMVEAYMSGIENTIYQLFANMPLTKPLTAVFLVAVFLSFVTAADSTIIAISGLSAKGLGDEESPAWMKWLWSVEIALITLIMMNVGSGVDGLKIISNVGGLPAAFFLIFVVAAAIKLLAQKDKGYVE